MTTTTPVETERRDRVVIRFAGDSGDGMQLAGTRFTEASAIFGNDLVTLPSFPAEIRAPAGSVIGVSSFQVHIADHDILTPGDAPDVLVAMNPAALKANLADLLPGCIIVVNTDGFDERNLEKAGFATDPLTDGSLASYRVLEAPMESLTKEAVAGTGVSGRGILRSKNFFSLGLLAWMFHRPLDTIDNWIDQQFAKNPEVRNANRASLKAGYHFGETTEAFHHTYEILPAKMPAGTYTNVTGNQAVAWGLIAAAAAARIPLFYSSYPITPASDILQELSRHTNFGVRAVQAEDEIAAVGMALGAAFGGHLGATGTSGPGLVLKSETISLALMTELPLVVVDVQRGGPSTGLPTKTEQGDLLLALYGRGGEAPMPVIAISSPADAFESTIEAVRLALKYMTPVLLLSDGYIANSSEPWLMPQLSDLPDISVPFASQPNHEDRFFPYVRDPATLARSWAIPGTPGLEHRVGGLEKEDITGNVSYDPDNHEKMVLLRRDKINRIANDVSPVTVDGDPDAELLVVGWGSTRLAITAAIRNLAKRDLGVAQVHLRHLNPFPANLGEVLRRYPKVLVPEINTGQLSRLLRAEFLVATGGYNRVRGVPFRVRELEAAMTEALKS